MVSLLTGKFALIGGPMKSLIVSVTMAFATTFIGPVAFAQVPQTGVSKLAPKKVASKKPRLDQRTLSGTVVLFPEQFDPGSRLYRYTPESGHGCNIGVERNARNTVGQMLDLAAACRYSDSMV